MKRYFSLLFIITGLSALLAGAFIGVLTSFVYIAPDFLKAHIPFNQLRPLHTTLVVSWIILTSVGGIYFYMRKFEKLPHFSSRMGVFHIILYLFIGAVIIISLITNNMGGREYLAFPPLLILPILVGWVLFGINYFNSMLKSVKNWPAYYWMWGIGICFMIFHLMEANFWVFDYFRKDYVRDLTVQWKSYGSFVGSWNMLVYGTALFVMSKIKDSINIARGRITFFFMFLGLTNLMFGWAHHTYIIPTLPWVRYLAYMISMTEWIIFIKIIYSWSRSLSKQEKKEHSMAYKFLIASDIWVFLNLVMALFMSIPAFNFYSHGTHITVAHSMGTTIGINTCVLFASVFFILSKLNLNTVKNKFAVFSFYLFNVSLLLFWLTLIFVGVYKIYLVEHGATFSEIHESTGLGYLSFIVTGILLFISIAMITIPLIRKISRYSIRVFYPEEVLDTIERNEDQEV